MYVLSIHLPSYFILIYYGCVILHNVCAERHTSRFYLWPYKLHNHKACRLGLSAKKLQRAFNFKVICCIETYREFCMADTVWETHCNADMFAGPIQLATDIICMTYQLQCSMKYRRKADIIRYAHSSNKWHCLRVGSPRSEPPLTYINSDSYLVIPCITLPCYV